jgi:oligopeptide transport system ATP-binding protein
MMVRDIHLEAEHLTKQYPARGGRVLRAVDGVSLAVERGETLGLVGESGCGKSTLGRLICRLEDPTSGRLRLGDLDLLALAPSELRALRPRLQMIFQDPFASLNPHKSVEQIVSLPLRIRGVRGNGEIRRRARELLEIVGLDPAQANRFPHQFSGGQRQRIGIARALACNPEFVVADEPVASLDVSIQAQIIDVLRDLQDRLHLTVVFISHDISVVSHVSRRIAVMYLGRLVEIGPALDVIESPAHPYTRALLEAVPRVGHARTASTLLPGDIPSPTAVPPGCSFHTRCPIGQAAECREMRPELREVAAGHLVACHLAGADEPEGAPAPRPPSRRSQPPGGC